MTSEPTVLPVPIVLNMGEAVRFLCRTCDHYIGWHDLIPLEFQGSAALYHETGEVPPLPCGPIYAELVGGLNTTVIDMPGGSNGPS